MGNGAGMMYLDDLSNASAVLFNGPTTQMRNYLTENVNNYISMVKDVAPDFANAVKQKYEDITNSSVVRHIANLKNKISSIWKTDTVRFLKDISSIQMAPDVMKKYIMANPMIRELYQQGCVSAYTNTYVDEHPNTIGKDHYDYRRVTENVMVKEEDFTGYRVYYETVKEEDLLSLMNKTAILASWDIIANAFEQGNNSDPTSLMGEVI